MKAMLVLRRLALNTPLVKRLTVCGRRWGELLRISFVSSSQTDHLQPGSLVRIEEMQRHKERRHPSLAKLVL